MVSRNVKIISKVPWIKKLPPNEELNINLPSEIKTVKDVLNLLEVDELLLDYIFLIINGKRAALSYELSGGETIIVFPAITGG